MNLYLQNIVNSIPFENLPAEWHEFDYVRFSRKNLFDYQQNALKNALKALLKYYRDCGACKQKFFEVYENNGFSENLDITLNTSTQKIYSDYDSDFKIEDRKIAFHNFINRMSFWMATGSGKTLVIVKLIELLAQLLENKILPDEGFEILFLTYREDLIRQFVEHVEEFNAFNNSVTIELHNLKDYEKVKRENRLRFGKTIDVFYYRSDLISDEQKDKIINFRNYDNGGRWFILLDEAHKGDREDSKRQHFYSILARNGFLFNFSATFTDPIDYVTCVFNFNLEQFIQNGYGKHVYVSQSNIAEITQREDFSKKEKQKIILKILLLHAYIKKQRLEITANFYHDPLIVTLVNSVNTEDSDLLLFFKELEKIANGQIANSEIIEEAQEELIEELNGLLEFEDKKLSVDRELLKTLNYKDILRFVFNAETSGQIEVLKIPSNKQELALKLQTSDNPFALIKIGDISDWIKNKLSGYIITETFDNQSIFQNINEKNSPINLLMGSRAFYEGWDSNRPNIILYINIGKGRDARKFVLQSLGRGVRIEPIPNKRKRALFLYNNKELSEADYNVIKNKAEALETLFVFGTKAENLVEVISTLKEEKQEEDIGHLFIKNPAIHDEIPLLIPVYEKSRRYLSEEEYQIKFEIHPTDFKLTSEYFEYLGEKPTLVKYDFQPKILSVMRESFRNKSRFFIINDDLPLFQNPDLLLRKMYAHFTNRVELLKDFKMLEDEIVHFKRIKGKREHVEQISQAIQQVLRCKDKDSLIKEITRKIEADPQNAQVYVREIQKIEQEYRPDRLVPLPQQTLNIKYLHNHYYLPVVLSEREKQSYITHIIRHESEVKFIRELDSYLQKDDNIFRQFDWWYFSKVDEKDDVYIPYYQPKTNKVEKFKPDFIFWLKKDSNYTILFVDPKGIEHADGQRKIDGYCRLFEVEENGVKSPKEFTFDGLKIKIKLFLFTKDVNNVPENYRKYWFDNFESLRLKLES